MIFGIIFVIGYAVFAILMARSDIRGPKPRDPAAEAEAARSRPPELPMGTFTLAMLLLKDRKKL